MMEAFVYPKRLIEVDLPIKRISAHARREKSIRHGHISTLHIWWARRPLAACRAVLCASLWPDPGSEGCPEAFVKEARRLMGVWAKENKKLASPESYARFDVIEKAPSLLDDGVQLRKALLDFIADFANYDNSTSKEYLDTARGLTQSAHESLGGEKGTRPLVVDPFAGGGSIPIEALRIGADAFANDLNPVAVLLNKVVLEYVPKYGQHLAEEIRKWGDLINNEAKKELAEFYPDDPAGTTPIAYLWARTIDCEGPACGAEVPLIRSLWLAKKGVDSLALRIIPQTRHNRMTFEIIEKATTRNVGDGTVQRGSASCPRCGYTTPVARVREQLRSRRGGTDDALLIAVRCDDIKTGKRSFRLPTPTDVEATLKASAYLKTAKLSSFIPDESTSHYHSFVNRGPIYGMNQWRDYFAPRQLLSLATIARLVANSIDKYGGELPKDFALAVQSCLALSLDRLADFNSSLCVLNSVGGRGVVHTFGRQALPFVWDFMETNPFNKVGANWISGIEAFDTFISQACKSGFSAGQASLGSATNIALPDDSAQAIATDPPYYYSVQYADLSDFFYVWLRRTLRSAHPLLLGQPLTPKEDEIIVQSPGHQFALEGKNKKHYEQRLAAALSDSRRVLTPSGLGLVVFAHSSTAGWEAMLQAMVDSGWVITASWPIDTERSARLLAIDRAVLASSVHLVCRPRENPDGSLRTDDIGDWRDVLNELPKRIHEWMPRLAEEGVVGADAIFACLGPALEVFSRYSRVEKASGEKVELKEYLEQVWAAVAKEALTMIFAGAQTTGFEEDSRLTAMWLWTLSAGDSTTEGTEDTEEATEEEEDDKSKKKVKGGFALEYDAARKIAQGLGAHLEKLDHLVEVKGDTARLLPVAERTRYLFGKDDAQAAGPSKKKKVVQRTLAFEDELEAAEEEGGWGDKQAPKAGNTVLDRVHQSMILFAAGRSDALKRFLVEDGIGRDDRFWRLAQALSALYPKAIDEKRWVDGVLARKKGLGF